MHCTFRGLNATKEFMLPNNNFSVVVSCVSVEYDPFKAKFSISGSAPVIEKC